MRYYRVPDGDGMHLLARDGETTHDLTLARPELTAFRDLVRAASLAGLSVDELARRVATDGRSDRAVDGEEGNENGGDSEEPSVDVDPTDRQGSLARPVVPDEVWAAGVTYRMSEDAREAESTVPDSYREVYEADRPELFFKATPSRTVGPGEDVGVRADSDWDVPEPELGVVLYRGDPVGYTVGNDVSSRAIEGANPLYLPQAKIYDRCCALGPCVASPETVGDPHDRSMSMTVRRDGREVFDGETSTAEMVRTCGELASWLSRSDAVPELAVLLTGTGLVPEDPFTLEPGDEVTIELESVGRLENGVREV